MRPGITPRGRSVAVAHFGLGEAIVRTLTALSLPDLAAPFGIRHPALHIASAAQVGALDDLEAVHRQFGCDHTRITPDEARALLPVLKTGPDHCHAALVDHGALKLDTDAMLQAHLAELRSAGGALVARARVGAIVREGQGWRVEAGDANLRRAASRQRRWRMGGRESRGWRAPGPIGIQPRRRTVISFRRA